MKIEGYTTEVFLENFVNDCEVFGEDTTQAIYEEIFSALYGKKIKLGHFVELLENLSCEEETINEAPSPADIRTMQDYAAQAAKAHDLAKNSDLVKQAAEVVNTIKGANTYEAAVANQQALGTMNSIIQGSNVEAAKAVSDISGRLATSQLPHRAGFLAKIGGFLKTLPAKVKTFFGGLQGKSFGEIMKQGMAWLSANPMLALKTTGGIALVALLIRALKKRGELNKYKQLQAIYDRGQSLREDIDKYTQEGIAMNKIIEECKTNKALNELIFGEEKIEDKKSYFGY
jgi:hypothetical protein